MRKLLVIPILVAGCATSSDRGEWITKEKRQELRANDWETTTTIPVLEHHSITLFFPTESSELTHYQKQRLSGWLGNLDDKSVRTVRVDGFADPRGNEGFNQKLAETRAQVVYDYMNSQGIYADQINIVGQGEKTNTTLAKARQVKIQIVE